MVFFFFFFLQERAEAVALGESSAAQRIALTEAGIPKRTAGEINQSFVLQSASNPPLLQFPNNLTFRALTPLCDYSI